MICGSVFAVSETQRRSAAAAFEEYSAVRELRGAVTQIALAFDEAALHGADAAKEVEGTQRTVVRAIAGVQSRADGDEASENRLVRQQVKAATALTALANEALRGGPHARLEARRDVLLERFNESNDELLKELAAERADARRSDVRRPVMLVLALFLVFALLHLFWSSARQVASAGDAARNESSGTRCR